MKKSFYSRYIIPAWLPALVALVVFVCSVMLWIVHRANELDQLRHEINLEAKIAAALLETDLRHRIKALSRFSEHWTDAGGLQHEVWKRYAEQLYASQPGYQALEWVNPDYKVAWVVPLAGNERAVGLDLSSEETRYRTLQSSMNTSQPFMSDPVQLIQGGLGSLLFIPLKKAGAFDGFLLAVFRLEDWITGVMDLHPVSFAISIELNSNRIYKTDTYNEDHARELGAEAYSWSLFGNIWSINAVPITPSPRDKWNLNLGFAEFSGGVLISLLVGVSLQMVRLTMLRERRVMAISRELERSNEELTRFAYVASHDLREPLRGITHLADWIQEDMDGHLTREAHGHLEKLRGRVSRMDHLLEDLLLYSRAGRLQGSLRKVDVAELVNDLWESGRHPPGARLQIGSMPVLETLQPPLQQVFANLIGNALKHGGKDDLVINISSRKRGSSWIVFTVSDNGKGIPEHLHDKAFEIYQTLQPRDVTEGSGMGLAIVKKTIERFGGRIKLTSAPGQGCAFEFTWPLRIEIENEQETAG